jgi:aryl-alcohol dehydrogenase-like predicted oxidoreductase
MKRVILGDTGIAVSPLGLGTVKFGRNEKVKYPSAFELPTDTEILNLLACAKELGINLLDTAPAYGLSEERLGIAIKGQRTDWIIATKVGEEFESGKSFFDFSEAHTIKSIERSLQRLGTDYLDIVLIHSNGEDEKILRETPVLETLKKLQQKGSIKAIGASIKTIAGGKLSVDETDIVMVTYNLLETTEKAVIDYAQQKNKSIFIKKALASGHLVQIADEDPILTALRFIFEEKAVSSIILGTLNPKHLLHNVECLRQILDSKVY